MPFDVCEASLDDIPTISAIEAAAFGPEALQNLMFPPEPTRDSYGPWADEKYRDQLKSPVCKFLMAKDTDTGEVVSVSKWYFYEKATDIDPKPTVMGSFPVGANGELYNHWKKLMKDKRTEIMGKKPYYLLALLTTHPTHQRRGAGSALVTHGTDLADAAGLPCYLEASPEGYGLYRKYGFERVDTIVLPLEDWGGEGEWTGVVMVRLPKRG